VVVDEATMKQTLEEVPETLEQYLQPETFDSELADFEHFLDLLFFAVADHDRIHCK